MGIEMEMGMGIEMGMGTEMRTEMGMKMRKFSFLISLDFNVFIPLTMYLSQLTLGFSHHLHLYQK